MEIKLSDFGDGGAITSFGGDIAQDDTNLTSIYLSLFNGDCFYNIYTDYPSDKSFEDAINAPVNRQNLKNAETAAYNLLQWMIEKNVVESIDVKAYGGENNKINVDITTIDTENNNQLYSVGWQNEKPILKKVE